MKQSLTNYQCRFNSSASSYFSVYWGKTNKIFLIIQIDFGVEFSRKLQVVCVRPLLDAKHKWPDAELDLSNINKTVITHRASGGWFLNQRKIHCLFHESSTSAAHEIKFWIVFLQRMVLDFSLEPWRKKATKSQNKVNVIKKKKIWRGVDETELEDKYITVRRNYVANRRSQR